MYDLLANYSLPWSICFTTAPYPKDKLILHPQESIQDVFLNSVKEADCLRHGSTKRVLNLSKSELDSLWNGLQNTSHDQFWNINKKLVDATSVRHIPVKLHLKGRGVLQDLITSKDSEGHETTLADTLSKFGLTKPNRPKSWSPSTSHEHAQPAPASSHVSLVPEQLTDVSIHKCTLHGIVLPEDSSISWLSRTMSYPDGFLHIAVD